MNSIVFKWPLHNIWRLTIPRHQAIHPPRQGWVQGRPRGTRMQEAQPALGCAGREREEDGLFTWEAGGPAAATLGVSGARGFGRRDTAVPADVQIQHSSGPCRSHDTASRQLQSSSTLFFPRFLLQPPRQQNVSQERASRGQRNPFCGYWHFHM